MSEGKFKIMTHIQKVRTYLGHTVVLLLDRGEKHDKSKLLSPEIEISDGYDKMGGVVFLSDEYKKNLVKPAIVHHHAVNRHHPEFFRNKGSAEPQTSLLERMNLVDIMEMICDWKASVARNKNGNIYTSIEKGQLRFGYTDELKEILKNTARMLEDADLV